MKKKGVRQGVSKRKSGKKPLILALLVLGVVFCATKIRSISLQEKQQENQIKIEGIEKEIAEEQQRQQELADYELYINTEDFIIETAREKLGLVFPDEIIFQGK